MKKKRKRPASAAPRQTAARHVVRDLPMLAREAPIQTVDAENRTASLVWSRGAPVRRYDWWLDRHYIEELSLDPAHVRMERLQSGRAPVCDTHSAWSLSSVIGVVTSAELSNGEGLAEIKMSRRDDVAGVVQDLVDEIICNVSVGYDIHEIEMIPPEEEDGDWRYLAIDWEPCELSLVPMGADPEGAVESVRAQRAANPNAAIEPFKDRRTHPCVFSIRASAVTTPAPAGSTKRKSDMTEEQRRAAAAAKRKAALKLKRKKDEEERRRLAALAGGRSQSGARAEGDNGDDGDEAGDGDEEEEEEADDEGERSADAGDDTGDDGAERTADVVEIRASERRRISGIRNAVTMAQLPATFADDLIARNNGGMSVSQAGLACLREQARRSAGTQTRSPAVLGMSDEVDVRRERMGNALRLRANPNARLAPDAPAQRQAVEAAREFRGFTLIDLARESIVLAGGNARGLNRREIAVAALNLDQNMQRAAGMIGTSDLPFVMGNTVNRTLRDLYAEAPRTFTAWARRSVSPDFREVARVQLSGLTKMQKVNEGGEYKYMSFGDSAEKYSLVKYGGVVAITWETLVNDDLGAFERIPLMIVNEAAGLESDIVYAELLNNAALADGVALFHATHNNLMAASAITDATLTLGRAAMRKQTTPSGRQMNLAPAVLLAGPDNEGDANKYTSSQFVAAKGVDINPTYNTSLNVVIEGRLTGKQWYLLAQPGMVDTIEYAHLEGEEGLFTEQRIGFQVDGLEIKARTVFAAKAIDFRGMQKNVGA